MARVVMHSKNNIKVIEIKMGMEKLIGVVYYLSVLIFYGFFILLAGSHIYFSLGDQQIEEKAWSCYAFNDKGSQ